MEKHQVYRVTGFEIIDSYKIRIEFDDGEEREIDFKPVLEGEMYGALKEERIFNQVELDPEVHTLVWPNGADFDPETLRNWDQYIDVMEEKAKGWAAAKARP